MGDYLSSLHRVAVDRWMLAMVYLVWGLGALESAFSPTISPFWVSVPLGLVGGLMGLTVAGMFAFRGMPR